MSSRFVALEGGDGAGKSHHGRRLAAALRHAGWEVVLTREPGGTPLGEAIRGVLLGPDSDAMTPQAEALLFAAARAEHAATVIRPALEAGAVVITDRFTDSSVAYQGAGRGLGEARIEDLSTWATGGLWPGLTIVLDVPPELGLRRAAETNRMEAEPSSFHLAVRESLLRRAAAAPERYLVVSTEAPPDEVAASILAAVTLLLGAGPS